MHGLYDDKGCPVDEYHQAEKLCVGSAIGFVVRKGEQYDAELHGPQIDKKSTDLRLAVKRLYPDTDMYHWTIVAWNNSPERTVEEIIKVCKEAQI